MTKCIHCHTEHIGLPNDIVLKFWNGKVVIIWCSNCILDLHDEDEQMFLEVILSKWEGVMDKYK